MARATFVKSARKDILGYDEKVVIKKGESYYWWKFRFGGKIISKTPPRRSQLTQSEFYGTMYDIEDRISDLSALSADDLASEVEDIISEIQSLGEEQQDKLGNMPDSLQDAPTGELLQNRSEACDAIVSELESIDLEFSENEPDASATDEEKAEYDSLLESWIEDKIGEIQSVSFEYE